MTISRKYFYRHIITVLMSCQAASDGRDSKTIKKGEQESFELSPNINTYKKAYKLCTIGLYHLDIMFYDYSVLCQYCTGTFH